MNALPISQARDADLRLSQVAMERAAQRAHELPAQMGTELIFSTNGVMERLRPPEANAHHWVREPAAPYKA